MAGALHTPETRQRAWELYISRFGTLQEIARELGVPFETIKTWHARESWAAKRGEIERQMYENWRISYVRDIVRIRSEVIMNHLRIVHDIQDQIMTALENELTPRQLATVARALKTSWASVEGLLGKDSVQVMREQPLVQVGLQAHRAENLAGSSSFRADPF